MGEDYLAADEKPNRLKNLLQRLGKSPVVRKSKPALIIGFSVAVLFNLVAFFGGFGLWENSTLDWRFLFRGPQEMSPSDQVVILAIDDSSFEQLQVRWPWPRDMYGTLIDRLSGAGAKVIAFDLIFSEPSSDAKQKQDQSLQAAIERSRAWIVLASKFYMKKTPVGVQTSYVEAIPGIDPGKTHVGFVNIWADKDGITRHTKLMAVHLNQPYYSFNLKILTRYLKLQAPKITVGPHWLNYGRLHIPVEPGANLLINFRGGPGSFKTISVVNVYHEANFQYLLSRDPDVFRDKIVLVGPTFTESQDLHPTPFFADFGPTPGVEIHANILQTILGRAYLWPLPAQTSTLLILLLSLLLAVIIVHLRPLVSLLILLAFEIAYWMLAFWAFDAHDLILPIINPSLSLAGVYFVTMAYRVLTEERRSSQIKTMFSRYVSPKVVEELVRNPGAAGKLGGNKQVVTVLFSDIRGFTSMSEDMPPEAVVELLNEYFQAWTDNIFAQEGMVDKFIGDAVMAVFGAPVIHPDDAIRAVRTAVAMLASLQKLNAQWTARGQRTLKIGVGLNTGEAIVGNMGSTQAMGYTVIGDTVNVASRLEGLNKELGTSILISESTYARVRDFIEAREFTGVKVKGKAKEMKVYEVLALK